MADNWVRATQSNTNNFGFFGHVRMIGVPDLSTVLRSYWNIDVFGTWGDVNQYPPGSSIMRAGLGYSDDTVNITPITDALADWMDIETVAARVQFTQSTQNNWQINWGFVKDESVKSQRRNETGGDMFLSTAFEFGLSGAVAGFTVLGWHSSIDALIRTPGP